MLEYDALVCDLCKCNVESTIEIKVGSFTKDVCPTCYANLTKGY